MIDLLIHVDTFLSYIRRKRPFKYPHWLFCKDKYATQNYHALVCLLEHTTGFSFEDRTYKGPYYDLYLALFLSTNDRRGLKPKAISFKGDACFAYALQDIHGFLQHI